jgi:hypothetical protein
VWRSGAKPDSCTTVMTWVADLEDGGGGMVLRVWAGVQSPAPALGHPPLLTFDLGCVPRI